MANRMSPEALAAMDQANKDYNAYAIRDYARIIKDKVSDLNVFIKTAASIGVATEFLIDKHEEGEADYQTLRVITSERL